MFNRLFRRPEKPKAEEKTTTAIVQPTQPQPRVSYEIIKEVIEEPVQPQNQITVYGFTATPPDPIYIGWNQNSVETVTDKLNAIAQMVGAFVTKFNNLQATVKVFVKEITRRKPHYNQDDHFALGLYDVQRIIFNTGVFNPVTKTQTVPDARFQSTHYMCEVAVMQTRVRTETFFQKFRVDLESFGKDLNSNLQIPKRPKPTTTEGIVSHIQAKEAFVRDVQSLCNSAQALIEVSLYLKKYSKDPKNPEYFQGASPDYTRGVMQGIAILEINLDTDEERMREMIAHIGAFRDYVISTIAPY